MKYSYISILSTDSYLFGTLVLNKTLQNTYTKYPFNLLITPNISEETISILKQAEINTILIEPIKNPILDDKKDRRYYNYSKLNMWNLTQFDKIVYLDADMIVMDNIDELFDKPNLSAVNSGGMIKKDWVQLNSGLMVIEPSSAIFEDMREQIGKIEKEKGKGDQAFLHQYFSDWPERDELHLLHIYNLFDNHIEIHKKHFGFYLEEKSDNNLKFDPKRIKIIHFIGQTKPWNMIDEIKKSDKKDEQTNAQKIWVKIYREVKKDIRNKLSELT